VDLIGASNRAGRLRFALAVFAMVAVGVPAYELSQGVAPGRGVKAPTVGDLVQGRWFRAVDTRLEEEGKTADLVLPTYRELIYRAFRATTPKVVAGEDGWLFLAETSLVDHGAEGDALAAEHAALIGALARWWKAQGTTLLCVPVPNKELIASEHLPRRARARTRLPQLLAGLAAEGVAAVDLRPALDLAAGATFLPNDSHWSGFGARRAAEAAATAATAACGGAIPGKVVGAAFHEAPPAPHRGDLQRMIGFVEGSALDRSFSVLTRWTTGVRTDGGSLTTEEPGEIVVCGTSFSKSFAWASLTGAALGRVVTDATVAGRGPTIRLLALAERVRAGELPPPALIVWEFPEKHCFTRPQDFLEPLRVFAAAAHDESRFDSASATRLGVARRRHEEIDVASDEGDVLRGVGRASKPGERPDPRVVYDLKTPIPADGASALAVDVRTERPTTLKVYLDLGDGFREATAKTLRVPGEDRPARLLIPLAGTTPDAALRRVRVDPANDDTPFALEAPRLWRRIR
jgi:alginate O-acetyltransferase complex protein AlgJ